MKTKINIAIADDHPLMIDGIKTALSDTPEIEIVGEASNGLEIIEVVKATKPDLVLLDINMPELDGIDAAKILKKQFKELKIIMLTQFGEKGFIKHCQKIGVEGYLLKGCGKDELEKAINRVFMGGVYFNVDNNRNEYPNIDCTDSKPLLSCREQEVLRLFSNDYNIRQVAKKLEISITTVKTYKQRLKNKTGSKTLSGMMKWAYQNDII